MIRWSSFARWLHTWLTVSSVVLALVMSRVGPNGNLIGLKDAAVFGTLALYLPIARRSTMRSPILRFVPLAAVLAGAVLLSTENPLAVLASVRQLVAPYALIAVGFLAVRTASGYEVLLGTIRRNLWVLFAFGLAERAVGLWRFVDLHNYFAAKNVPLVGAVPVMFTEPIFGGIPRMASLLLDPINTGHALVCLMCLEATQRKPGRVAAAFLGVVLTTSKGALLHVVLVFWWLNRRVPVWFRTTTAGMVVLAVGAYGHLHGGIAVHLDGFLASFDNLTLLGHGIARAGNQAALFATTQPGEGIGDSFFGAIIGQVGLVGLAVWLAPIVGLVRRLPSNDMIRRLVTGQLLVAVLSENSFNLLSVYSAGLLLGAALAVRSTSPVRFPTLTPVP